MSQQDQRLTDLYRLVTNYTSKGHEKILPAPENEKLRWFEDFKFLNPASWAANPKKIPYIAATALIDSYSCLPRRPDMAFTYLWTAINNSYNDLFLIHNTVSKRLGDTKAIEKSLELISNILQSNVENRAPIPDEYESKTINEIVIEFVKRLPDKTLNFLASYILKGMAVTRHNGNQNTIKIREEKSISRPRIKHSQIDSKQSTIIYIGITGKTTQKFVPLKRLQIKPVWIMASAKQMRKLLEK